MILLDLIKKKLGYHVCEEFTQWECKEGTFERLATKEEYVWNDVRTAVYTRRWQERCCTICGKLYIMQL